MAAPMSQTMGQYEISASLTRKPNTGIPPMRAFRIFPAPEGSGRSGHAPQQVDLAIERHDQAVNPLAPKNRTELRALYRQLADCAVEIDVGDLPGTLVLAHQIIKSCCLTV